MTTEAASLALAVDRHDRDLDAEEHPEWVATYPHATYDPFVED